MIKVGSTVRSRRRRSTFALFGRPLQRGSVQPFPDRIWPIEDPMHAIIVEQEDGGVPPLRHDEPDLQETIGRVQQDARADRHLAGRIPAAELDRLIDETVRSLWATSSVKTFVPLIALRHARATLDGAAGVAEPGVRSGGSDA